MSDRVEEPRAPASADAVRSRPGGQASASAGGLEAPPAPEASNQAPPVTREYRSGQIAVQWYAERCIHSARCIRAAPGVFDPQRRPWIDLSGAPADLIAEAVERCPTGALHYTRFDGGRPETVPDEPVVSVVRDGPLYVRGDVVITLEDGSVVRHDNRVALCRCGQSKHMPFCDNTHRATGFRDPAR
jgi:uncharacterized Fe-S cluster protein YjdI